MDCDTARQRLTQQFKGPIKISDTSLRRIWSAEGLTQSVDIPRMNQGNAMMVALL